MSTTVVDSALQHFRICSKKDTREKTLHGYEVAGSSLFAFVTIDLASTFVVLKYMC